MAGPLLSTIRARYARDIMAPTRAAGFDDPRVERAFAEVAREQYLTPPPWRIFAPGGLMAEEISDPAKLYGDVLVVLDRQKGINNGQPSLHAGWLTAVGARPGETVVQVGSGSGYYTAILAWLVGPGGRVFAYEIDRSLARLASVNLAGLGQVMVEPASGLDALPEADIVYVSAGAAAPPLAWLTALRPGGRLIFPWQPLPGHGTTLLVRRTARGFAARPIIPGVSFIPCVGADPRTTRIRGMPSRSIDATRSIWARSEREPDDTATAIYEDVWLSARKPP